MIQELYIKFRVLFNLTSSETVRCKKCKGYNVGISVKELKNKTLKWYRCRKCGRDFWSEEKNYDEKPKWFKYPKRK
jgi:uncharacterized protein with PIN domain